MFQQTKCFGPSLQRFCWFFFWLVFVVVVVVVVVLFVCLFKYLKAVALNLLFRFAYKYLCVFIRSMVLRGVSWVCSKNVLSPFYLKVCRIVGIIFSIPSICYSLPGAGMVSSSRGWDAVPMHHLLLSPAVIAAVINSNNNNNTSLLCRKCRQAGFYCTAVNIKIFR